MTSSEFDAERFSSVYRLLIMRVVSTDGLTVV